jgi:hypothetical protein
MVGMQPDRQAVASCGMERVRAREARGHVTRRRRLDLAGASRPIAREDKPRGRIERAGRDPAALDVDDISRLVLRQLRHAAEPADAPAKGGSRRVQNGAVAPARAVGVKLPLLRAARRGRWSSASARRTLKS